MFIFRTVRDAACHKESTKGGCMSKELRSESFSKGALVLALIQALALWWLHQSIDSGAWPASAPGGLFAAYLVAVFFALDPVGLMGTPSRSSAMGVGRCRGGVFGVHRLWVVWRDQLRRRSYRRLSTSLGSRVAYRTTDATCASRNGSMAHPLSRAFS